MKLISFLTIIICSFALLIVALEIKKSKQISNRCERACYPYDVVLTCSEDKVVCADANTSAKVINIVQ